MAEVNGGRSTDATAGAESLPAAVGPFGSTTEAVDAELLRLEDAGLGRWELVDRPLEDPLAAVVPLLLPDDPRTLALRAVDEVEEPAGLASTAVLRSARTIATLLAAEGGLDQLRQRVARAERESTTDELTGLANPRAWWRALSREEARCDRRSGLAAVVAVIDLDHLKRVNDEQGHLAGDEVLRATARALAAAVRPHDVVARLGGDEFGVLAVDYDEQSPGVLVARLEAHLRSAGVEASIGAVRYTSGEVITEAYRRADAEMYKAKRAATRERDRVVDLRAEADQPEG